MSFAGLLNQPLTLQYRGAAAYDPYGNEVLEVASSSTVDGYVEQTKATEVTVDRETYVTEWLVLVPAGAHADVAGRVLWRVLDGTRTLEVIGKPNQAWNPRTRSVHHVECRCVEVTG